MWRISKWLKLECPRLYVRVRRTKIVTHLGMYANRERNQEAHKGEEIDGVRE